MHEWAELCHFRFLLKILEKQVFRAAAEELHTSLPNLTVQARQFQEYASVRLFRGLKNGSIRPTETGIAFISPANLLLDSCGEVINALTHNRTGRYPYGTIRMQLGDPSLFHDFCAVPKKYPASDSDREEVSD